MRILFFLFLILAGLFLISLTVKPAAKPAFGINFAKAHAEWLGLDWREVFRASLDDLGARILRISVNWNAVEPARDKFIFDDLDWFLSEAEARQAKVILVVGRKLPRWPECHDPDWVRGLKREELEERILAMLEKVVGHAKKSRAVAAWQVENEPFFHFGECGKLLTRNFLKKEIALVKSLDSRPIILTDSGELSSWLRTSSLADVLGISMYRKVWHKWFGYLRYPIPAVYYGIHAKLIKPLVSKVIVTELQAEPWVTRDLRDLTVSEQFKSFSPDDFKKTVNYARRAGFDEFYFWGAEWWYWLKVKKGEPAIWEEAKKVIKNNR